MSRHSADFEQTLGEAVDAARTFLNALSEGDHQRADALVAPAGRAAFRDAQLASLTSWAQQRSAIKALQTGAGDGMVGWSSSCEWTASGQSISRPPVTTSSMRHG